MMKVDESQKSIRWIKKIDCQIPKEITEKWQNIANLLAEVIGIPAALIMRLVKEDIEVFVSSESKGNPYHPGDHEHFLGSGLYCETVIKNDQRLLVPNARKDDDWKNNPDIKLNMISYLGYPINFPDGTPFGTICVLDAKENHYSDTYGDLIANLRDVIQSQLELVFLNYSLGEQNKELTDYLNELKILRGIMPICCYCKKIQTEKGKWEDVVSFVTLNTEATFSHTYCPHCMQEHFGELMKK